MKVRDVLSGVVSTYFIPDPPSQGSHTTETYLTLTGNAYAISLQDVRIQNTYNSAPTPSGVEQALNRMAQSLEQLAAYRPSPSGLEGELEYWKIRCSAYEMELREAQEKLARLT